MFATINYKPRQLFHIETNSDFHWKQIDITNVLTEVAKKYGFRHVTQASIVQKLNHNSVICRMVTDQGNFILRSVSSDEETVVETQCDIVISVAYPSIIKPIRQENGKFSCVLNNRVWMAYPEQKGNIFSGKECSVEIIIKEAIALENALQDVEQVIPFEKKRKLPIVKHHPEEWMPFFNTITNSTEQTNPPFIDENLSAEGKKSLWKNREFISSCVGKAAQLPIGNQLGLVHNDLQHANILICDHRPFFLDIEDICFENREIAIAHTVFKVLRHTIFSGTNNVAELRQTVVPRVIKLLGLEGFKIYGPTDFFLYSSYRIISDIWEIVRYTLHFQNESQLYDLEKRICNLFELYLLLEE